MRYKEDGETGKQLNYLETRETSIKTKLEYESEE